MLLVARFGVDCFGCLILIGACVGVCVLGLVFSYLGCLFGF